MSTTTTRKPRAAKAAPAPASAYEPEAYYKVQLARPLPLPGEGSRQLLPCHVHRLKGSFLETVDPAAILSAVKHVPPAQG